MHTLSAGVRVRGADVTIRDVTIKTPDREMGPGMWMTSCQEALRIWGIWKKSVSWDSSLEEGSRFLVSPRRDQLGSTKCAARGGLRWKSQHSKKLYFSLLMLKNLKLKKVIKSFVPEPISCFSDSYMFMNICERFPYRYEYVHFTCSYLGRISGPIYIT